MTLNDHFNQLIKNLQFLTKDKLTPNENDFFKSLIRQTQTSIAEDPDIINKPDKFLLGSFKSGGQHEQIK